MGRREWHHHRGCEPVTTGREAVSRSSVGPVGATYRKVRSCTPGEPMLTSSLQAVSPPAEGCSDVTPPAPAILDRPRQSTMPCDGDSWNRVAEEAAGGPRIAEGLGDEQGDLRHRHVTRGLRRRAERSIPAKS